MLDAHMKTYYFWFCIKAHKRTSSDPSVIENFLENNFGTSYLKCKYVVIRGHDNDLTHNRECNIYFRMLPLGIILIHAGFLHERENFST